MEFLPRRRIILGDAVKGRDGQLAPAFERQPIGRIVAAIVLTAAEVRLTRGRRRRLEVIECGRRSGRSIRQGERGRGPLGRRRARITQIARVILR